MAEDVGTGGMTLRRFRFEAVIYSAQFLHAFRRTRSTFLTTQVISFPHYAYITLLNLLVCTPNWAETVLSPKVWEHPNSTSSSMGWSRGGRRSSDLSLTEFTGPEERLQTPEVIEEGKRGSSQALVAFSLLCGHYSSDVWEADGHLLLPTPIRSPGLIATLVLLWIIQGSCQFCWRF